MHFVSFFAFLLFSPDKFRIRGIDKKECKRVTKQSNTIIVNDSQNWGSSLLCNLL